MVSLLAPAGSVSVAVSGAALEGDLVLPVGATGIVAFAHGSGSSRHSARNRFVASALAEAGLGTRHRPLTATEEAWRCDMRAQKLRGTLIGSSSSSGVTTIAGAILVVPSLPREWLAGGPFSDYAIPALALCVVCGGGALAAAALVARRPALGGLASVLAGGAMAAFEIVEAAVVGLLVLEFSSELPSYR